MVATCLVHIIEFDETSFALIDLAEAEGLPLVMGPPSLRLSLLDTVRAFFLVSLHGTGDAFSPAA